MVPPVAVPALFSEIVGQISCFYLNNKTNCPQKMVILDQFDFVNVGAVNGYTIVNKELVKDEEEELDENDYPITSQRANKEINQVITPAKKKNAQTKLPGWKRLKSNYRGSAPPGAGGS